MWSASNRRVKAVWAVHKRGMTPLYPSFPPVLPLCSMYTFTIRHITYLIILPTRDSYIATIRCTVPIEF